MRLEAVNEMVAVAPSLARQVMGWGDLHEEQRLALERIVALCADADAELHARDDARWAMVADRFDRIDKALHHLHNVTSVLKARGGP